MQIPAESLNDASLSADVRDRDKEGSEEGGRTHIGLLHSLLEDADHKEIALPVRGSSGAWMHAVCRKFSGGVSENEAGVVCQLFRPARKRRLFFRGFTSADAEIKGM